MKAMTATQVERLVFAVSHAKQAVNTIAMVRDLAGESEDLDVAQARLENWLSENEGRWVA